MGTPTRHVNSIWLFDEVTEFSKDINPFVASIELLSAPASSPLVEPGRIETICDAPLTVSTQEDAPLTASTQEEELFLQRVFDYVSSSFPELALTSLSVVLHLWKRLSQ